MEFEIVNLKEFKKGFYMFSIKYGEATINYFKLIQNKEMQWFISLPQLQYNNKYHTVVVFDNDFKARLLEQVLILMDIKDKENKEEYPF